MQTDLRPLMVVAQEAIDHVASCVRERQISTVSAKGDRDMVTDLDLLVERSIRRHLKVATPHLAFLGEEEGRDGTGDGTWVLDPIDGTANLVRGIPLFGVSLALVREERPVLGVIDLAGLGHRYWAGDGLGAFRDGRPIAVAPVCDLADAIVGIGDYMYGSGMQDRNSTAFAVHRALAAKVQRVRMLGSAAVDLAWLADGGLAASITLNNNDWDMAAGIVIAREAGATVTDILGEEHSTESSTAVASTPRLHQHLLTLLNDAVNDNCGETAC